ncbi:UDP-N-acetylmuramyl-tripeptide synthetase, partial [Bienertia sinuspersici]
KSLLKSDFTWSGKSSKGSLPSDCWPNFSSAWLTKLLLKYGGFITGIMSVVLFTVCSRMLCSFPRAVAEMIASLIRQLIFSWVFLFLTYFSIWGG